MQHNDPPAPAKDIEVIINVHIFKENIIINNIDMITKTAAVATTTIYI